MNTDKNKGISSQISSKSNPRQRDPKADIRSKGFKNPLCLVIARRKYHLARTP